jgi:malyl-CoA/(S)-citramalyl-CoA lyase
MGCVVAWSLHPSQIEIARKVFSSPINEVAWARRVLAALPDGSGAVVEVVQGDGGSGAADC